MTVGRALLWISSAAGIGLFLRSVVFRPVPLWVASVSMLAYLAVILLGVMVPQLEMFADIVWKGPRDRSEIALTFDDGPHPLHTRKILDILASYDAKATFFVVGHKVDKNPDVVREILARGHELGVHSYTHDRFLSLRHPLAIQKEITRTIEAIRIATNCSTHLFRPPVGHVSPRTEIAVRKTDVVLVAWSVRAHDGIGSTSSKQVVSRIARRIRPGSIVLLHDAAEHDDRIPASIDALPDILSEVHAKGLTTVLVSQWIEESV